MNRPFLIVLFLAAAAVSCKFNKKPTPEPMGMEVAGVPMQMKSREGKYLTLADASNWAVQPVSQEIVIRWNQGDPIGVQRVDHPVWPFVLVNHRTRNSILARPLAPMQPQAGFRMF